MTLRTLLTEQELRESVECIVDKLEYRKFQKGLGSMASKHEILGILDEECYEYRKAVHEKLDKYELIEELKDIAVAAIFGIASIQSDKVDW